MATYTTTVQKFEELTKKVNRIFKKIDKFNPNVFHEFYEIRRYVTEVPVYVIGYNGNHKEEKRQEQDALVEVVDFELTVDERVTASEGSRTVAILESVSEDKNLVYVVNKDEEENYNRYANIPLRCDHCKRNHNRKKVAVIQKASGEEIMVGISCLKDYYGYDEDVVVNGFRQVDAIVEDLTKLEMDYNEFDRATKYIETRDYLTKCIAEIRKNGYKNSFDKNPTKYAARTVKCVTEEDEAIADKVIDLFKNYKAEVSFDQNIKTAVTQEYCKVADGFVAYAYVAYLKIMENESFKRKKEEEKVVSQFVGNVGDKVNLTVKVVHAGGYSTQFGYTNIWRFTDDNGNVFVWKTQNDIDGMWDYKEDKWNHNKRYTVVGKIKEHSEYNGEKQTVLTRCKVCEVA